jgi:hypothetical protein
VAGWLALDLLVAGWGLNPAGDISLYGPGPGAVKVWGLEMGASGRLFIPEAHEYELKYERFLRFDTFDPGQDWNNLRAAILANANLLDGVPSANNFDPLTPGRYATWMELLNRAEPSTLAHADLMAVRSRNLLVEHPGGEFPALPQRRTGALGALRVACPGCPIGLAAGGGWRGRLSPAGDPGSAGPAGLRPLRTAAARCGWRSTDDCS